MLTVVQELGPAEGISALFQGMRLFSRDRFLRTRLYKAVFFNLILLAALLLGMTWGAFALTGGWVEGSWWEVALGWVARIAVMLGMLALAPVLFTVVCGIFMPAFYGSIFRRARELAGGPPMADDGGARKEIAFVLIDLRRLGRLIVFSLLLLLLNFVPIIGSVVYFVAQALLASHTLGWDLIGRHLELHDVRYGQQRAFIATRRRLVLATGFVAGLLCLVPFLQLVFVTTNVAGAGVMSAWMDGAARTRQVAGAG
jgi:CysZ protein